VASGEAGTKHIFPSLDRSFGGVSAVAVQWDALEIDVILCEVFLSLSAHSLSMMCSSGANPFVWSLVWRLVQALVVISLAWRVLRGAERIALLS
jgi:hypothetical protein